MRIFLKIKNNLKKKCILNGVYEGFLYKKNNNKEMGRKIKKMKKKGKMKN